ASQGKINEAIEDFKKASQLDDNPEFMYSLAITYLNIGQKEQACMILSTQKQLQHPPSFDLFQQACR
ncbi:MAG TPA: tetratricopeptide repeat protein, partial [Bacteroidia bacterium]|nr:tetratricopeptide repeat protein [Bacteroidia bacterium]